LTLINKRGQNISWKKPIAVGVYDAEGEEAFLAVKFVAAAFIIFGLSAASKLISVAFAAEPQTNAIVTIPAKQTELKPKSKILYRLEGNFIYKTMEPGPSEWITHGAWRLANEFVFRTMLRKECVLPSSSASPRQNGVMVLFKKKDGGRSVSVLVRTDERIIEYKE
jgi:hypothetical protein